MLRSQPMSKGKKRALLASALLLLVGGTVASMLTLPTFKVSFVRATGAVRSSVTRVEIAEEGGESRATTDRAAIDAFLDEVSSQTFTKGLLSRLDGTEQAFQAYDLRYSVRLYVGEEYIQYNEDGRFTASGGYFGRVIRGRYVPDDVAALGGILERFYQTLS